MEFTGDQLLLEQIRASNYTAFEEMHRLYHKELLTLALKKLGDRDEARDLLQDMFIELWEKRETFHLSNSLQSYLRNRLWFKLSDHFRRKGFREKHLNALGAYLLQESTPAADAIELSIIEEQYQLLIDRIDDAVNDMPARMREIFKLSRDGAHTTPEIADRLGLSAKTVSNQLNLAIKWIRRSLGDQPLSNLQLLALLWLTKN